MLRSTFTFIPGLGEKTEEYLWRRGILSWDQLDESGRIAGIGRSKRKIIGDYLDRAREALDVEDVSFFGNRLPQKEHWRLYSDFRDQTLFLDIETTGLSLYYDAVTLVGTFDRERIRMFVRDNNLDEIVNLLRDYDILVTFNGKLFDVPFLEKEFPGIVIPQIHIDLRYLLRSVGLSGPLKKVERAIGLRRDDSVDHVNGREAAVLWTKFLKGDDEAMEKLARYNIYDTRNLRALMDYCYSKKMKDEILPRMNQAHGQVSLYGKNIGGVSGYNPTPATTHSPEVVLNTESHPFELRYQNQLLVKIEKERIRRTDVKLDHLLKAIDRRNHDAVVVGIDLSGSEARPSGVCVLQRDTANLSTAGKDAEILSVVLDSKPSVVSIDSPLSLPAGRCCTSDSCDCRKHGITREIERILRKRGIHVYPCLIQSMQQLTERGMHLCRVLEDEGFEVIESYPGAAQDILGFPRKRVNLQQLEVDLMNMGIRPLSKAEKVTHDEIDALTSALVGYFYLGGMYEAVGNIEEGYMIIPSLDESVGRPQG